MRGVDRVELAASPGAVVEGRGLHTGAWGRVRLCARPGPVTLAVAGVEASIDDLSVVQTHRGTAVEASIDDLPAVRTRRPTTIETKGVRFRVATVEHLFAALGGLGIRDGVALHVDGPELPLLDGGAATWCDRLAALGVGGAPPRSRVARDADISVGESRYEFRVAEGVEIHVRFETPDPRVAPESRWLGDPVDFRRRIAPARTFAFAADLDALARHGLARGVDPAAVILLAPGAVHCVAPYSPDEPARHKLLDLVGDWFLWGGPAKGRLRALRPGHAANAEAFRRAAAEGIVVS